MDSVHEDPGYIASLLRARYKRRLPSSLDELTGPEHGMVELPLRIAWSGLRILDLDRPRQRMSLYRTVLLAVANTPQAHQQGHQGSLGRSISRAAIMINLPHAPPAPPQ